MKKLWMSSLAYYRRWNTLLHSNEIGDTIGEVKTVSNDAIAVRKMAANRFAYTARSCNRKLDLKHKSEIMIKNLIENWKALRITLLL